MCEFLNSQFREAIESGKDSACLEELIAETASVFDIKDSKTFLQVGLCSFPFYFEGFVPSWSTEASLSFLNAVS